MLVGFLVHEVEGLTVIIEELIGAALHGDGVKLYAGGECGALTGFYVLEVHYNAGFAVEHQVHSVLEVSSSCHKNSGMFS